MSCHILKAQIDLVAQGELQPDQITREVIRAAYDGNPTHFACLVMYGGDKRRVNNKDLFRRLFTYLMTFDIEVASQVLEQVPSLICWKEVILLIETSSYQYMVDYALGMFIRALRRDDQLALKWAPRPGKKSFPKARRLIMDALGLRPGPGRSIARCERDYRRLLTSNMIPDSSTCLETAMCSGRWNRINYTLVSRRARGLYKNAFLRRDGGRAGRYYLGGLTSYGVLPMTLMINRYSALVRSRDNDSPFS